MEYTQNYALRKPGLNEYANVGDLNFNADRIDSQMKKNQDVDGEVYDPTSTSANAYEAGDYVINPDDGLMYVCNGTTYGTWDATKWEHTTEFGELQKAMASGGESELANLHDVEITNPTDGQALLYDDTTGKWVNSDLPDADVTKEASGNPIEFEDGADAPLVKCVTQITGSQEGTGTPSPENIRPITAYTENTISVVGDELGGVNLIPPGEKKTLELDGITVTSDGKGRYTLKGTNTSQNVSWFTFSCKQITAPDGSSHSLGFMNNATGGVTFYFYNGDTEVTNWSLNSVNRTVSYSGLSNKVYDNYRFKVNAGSTVDITLSPMICAGNTSAFPSTFSTYYKYYDHTTTFPSAIYRGGEDVVNGSATCNWTVVDLGDLTWYKSGSMFYSEGVTDFKRGTPYNNRYYANAICSHYAYGVNDDPDATITLYYDSSSSLYRLWVNDPTKASMTPADFKTAMDGVQFAYELATPTTSSVTPTNLPIKSLLGYNHIESSTGEMDVEYIAKAFSPITEIVDSQISALSKMMELMITSARETTMTASANYTTGTLIVACGVLYKATTAISSGASLVVGTNITPTTIAAELAALA